MDKIPTCTPSLPHTLFSHSNCGISMLGNHDLSCPRNFTAESRLGSGQCPWSPLTDGLVALVYTECRAPTSLQCPHPPENWTCLSVPPIPFLIKHTCAASVSQPWATVGMGPTRHRVLRAGQAFLSPPLSVLILEPVPSFQTPGSALRNHLSPFCEEKNEPGFPWFPPSGLNTTATASRGGPAETEGP